MLKIIPILKQLFKEQTRLKICIYIYFYNPVINKIISKKQAEIHTMGLLGVMYIKEKRHPMFLHGMP